MSHDDEFLIKPFSKFQNDLHQIESEFLERLVDVEKKCEKIRNLDKKLKDVIEKESSKIVKIRVGNKQYMIKLGTLLSKRDSIFYKAAIDDVDAGRPITLEWFFDRPNVLFSLILDFVRTGIICIELMPTKMMKELQKEIEYYGFFGALELVNKMLSVVEIVAFTCSGRYSSAGTHSIEKIQEDTSGKYGICVQSPYWLTFELNCVHEFIGLELKGWTGNTGIWGVSNGENAKIETSLDGVKFESTGSIIPYGFGNEVKKILFKTGVTAKYIKFSHNSYLGIGYIKFLKSD